MYQQSFQLMKDFSVTSLSDYILKNHKKKCYQSANPCNIPWSFHSIIHFDIPIFRTFYVSFVLFSALAFAFLLFCLDVLCSFLTSRHPCTELNLRCWKRLAQAISADPPTQKFKDLEFLINFSSRSLRFRLLFRVVFKRRGGEWWRFNFYSMHMLRGFKERENLQAASEVDVKCRNRFTTLQNLRSKLHRQDLLSTTSRWLSSYSENGLFEFIIFLFIFLLLLEQSLEACLLFRLRKWELGKKIFT